MDILTGDRSSGGSLPYPLPRNMATVEAHDEDDPFGLEPYVCSDGIVYKTGFSAQ